MPSPPRLQYPLGACHDRRSPSRRTGQARRRRAGAGVCRGRHEAGPRHRLDGGLVRRSAGPADARRGAARHRRPQLQPDPGAGRGAGHPPGHARRGRLARPDDRRGGRIRCRSQPDQGRRRGAVAGEDRRHRLRPDGGDHRPLQRGRQARRVSAAGRGGALRCERDHAPDRGVAGAPRRRWARRDPASGRGRPLHLRRREHHRRSRSRPHRRSGPWSRPGCSAASPRWWWWETRTERHG